MALSIRLDTDGTPAYVQIRRQMLALIGRGELQPGEQLPTIRAVAVELGVNPSVVQQAFRELEADGAVVVQRGRGTFVASIPVPLDLAAIAADVELLAHQTVATAVARGVPPGEVGLRIVEIDAASNKGDTDV